MEYSLLPFIAYMYTHTHPHTTQMQRRGSMHNVKHIAYTYVYETTNNKMGFQQKYCSLPILIQTELPRATLAI